MNAVTAGLSVPEIRAVKPGDTDAVVALWERTLPEYGDPTRPQRAPRPSIRRKLDWGDGLFWLAVSDEEVVGTVMAGYDGHRGWIYSLAVHPDHRRGGLGTALVAHAEQELARLGCPKVNLQVLATNADGAEFWAATGYQPDPVLGLGKRLGG